MALRTFFHVYMPYTVKFYDSGEIAVFNREYLPLGFLNENFKGNLPIYMKISKIHDLNADVLSEIGVNTDVILGQDGKGNYLQIHLYNDRSNPVNGNEKNLWDSYFEKIRRLSRIINFSHMTGVPISNYPKKFLKEHKHIPDPFTEAQR